MILRCVFDCVILMNKKQKRSQLIQFFLTISQKQQEIQTVQNQLISHLRFNPLIIFKKISGGNNSLTFDQFKEYVKKNVSIEEGEVIKRYYFRHFKDASVKIDDFTASLLPYTPNILREAVEKIDKQMQTRHYDRIIQETYHRLLEIQLKSIYQICVLQGDLKMDWSEMKRFIKMEIGEFGKRIDTQVEEFCSIINIRKWMQLWVRVDEYKILNIMRWFGGFQEKHVKRIYENNLIHLKCTCSNHSNNLILSFQSGSQVRQRSLLRQQSAMKRLTKVKSQSKLVKDSKYFLKIFIKYVETIIKSQRRLTILRQGLRSYRRQTEQVLHQIASKKYKTTRLGKVIEQMQSVLHLKEDVVESLMTELEHTKVDNNFIFTLFASSAKKGKSSAVIKKEELLNQIFQVLYTFCLSKATLKSLARQLYPGSNEVFRELDENSHGFLDRTDLKLILGQSQIKCKQQDLTILMSHFGDGQQITKQSLKQVLQIQRSN